MRLVSVFAFSEVALGQSLFQGLKDLAFPQAQNPTMNPNVGKLAEEAQKPVVGDDPLAEMDLLCLNNVHAQEWFNVQQKLRYILGPDAAFNVLDKTNTLEPALYSVMEDMANTQGDEACGVGKLHVQLLSIIAIDTDGSVAKKQVLENEKLTSPILTLLLDIPWGTFQPMWPMFGLLAQLAMKRSQLGLNHESVDGLIHPELQQFAGALNMGIVNGDLKTLQTLAKAYLEAGIEAVEQSPIGFMTALFTQAAIAEDKEEAQAFFFEAQKVMKKMVFQPADLDTMLTTRWPLWGMAYLASLKTMG